MDSRICTTCKIDKPLTEYYRSKKEKGGRKYICKSCFADYQREYHKKNYEKLRQKRIAYRESESGKEVRKEYLKSEGYRRSQRNYLRKRRQSDPLFKMASNLRRRTRKAFDRSYWKKDSPTKQLLGCDYNKAFKHIENQFRDGMSWDNYGEWHIDHIIPLCSATTVEELEKLCHYKNLQPLWAEENILKGGKMPEDLL